MGHFNRRFTDAATGKIIRQQPAFVIGRVADLTEAQAKRACRERVEIECGLLPDQKSTVTWFIHHRWVPMREGTWRPSTRQTNLELLKVITDRFGLTALADMDLVDMQTWLNALAKKRSGSAVKHIRIFLKSIFAEAVEADFIRKNPARRLRLPRLKSVRRVYLTEPEIRALMEHTKFFPRECALLKLIFVTALRPSELFALRWRCLSPDFQTLTLSESVYRGVMRPFTKTTEEGDTAFVTLRIPDVIADALLLWHSKADFHEPDDFIFSNESGGFWWKENYQQRVLNELADRAGVKRFNYQILRRSVATHLQHLGSPKDTAAVMRHRKTDTAQANYVQEIDEKVREALDKLVVTLFAPKSAE